MAPLLFNVLSAGSLKKYGFKAFPFNIDGLIEIDSLTKFN